MNQNQKSCFEWIVENVHANQKHAEKRWQKLTIFFENKTWFLINEFFPISFSADLSDIFNATYLMLMHCPAVVTKKNDWNHEKLNSNKTFKLNNIINRFLKTCENDLINVLTSFCKTCVNWKYHFKTYQKNNTMILHKSDKNNYNVVKT